MILEEITISSSQAAGDSMAESAGRLNSEVIKTTRESIRQGFLDWSPRLLLAMYSCEIQTSSELCAGSDLTSDAS